MTEEWRIFTRKNRRYKVSSHGRVKALLQIRTLRRSDTGRIYTHRLPAKMLKQRLDQDGYPRTSIGTVHRLVAQAFIPNPKSKSEINHKNGIKTDNHVENLEWVTSKENKEHAVSNGIHANMRGNKIKPANVPVILTRLAHGKNRKMIASEFGVGVGAIIRIKNGETWTRIVKKWKEEFGEIPNKTWKKYTKTTTK